MKHVLFSLFLVFPSFVFAHAPEGAGGGFFTGFLHPILGFDHLIAMVAVGLWGAFLGDRALWILPIVFPSIMAVGAAIGIIGLEVPLVEFVIALSGVVLGALIALRTKRESPRSFEGWVTSIAEGDKAEVVPRAGMRLMCLAPCKAAWRTDNAAQRTASLFVKPGVPTMMNTLRSIDLFRSRRA